jgi:hypothetical protein
LENIGQQVKKNIINNENNLKKALTKRSERVEYASPLEVKLIKKKEQNKLSGHFVNKFRK